MGDRQRQPGCDDAACDQDREAKSQWATDKAFCDPCIVPLVRALNEAGFETIASCCGHGHRPGSIILRDGRWFVLARSYEEGKKIDRLFATDINGHSCDASQARIDELERALRYGVGTAINELISRDIPVGWTPYSGIGVMLRALGCDSVTLDDHVRSIIAATDKDRGDRCAWCGGEDLHPDTALGRPICHECANTKTIKTLTEEIPGVPN